MPKTKTKPMQQTVGSETPNSTIQVFDPQALEQAVHERLGPLAVRHEVVAG